jgi:hypothetical protein
MTINSPWCASYRDLPSALTRHVWLALMYALVSVISIYMLGLWHSPSILFFAFELPTLAVATYVTSGNPDFRFRLPLIWSLTALATWAYKLSVAPQNSSTWPSEVLSLCIIFLVAYSLVEAITSSISEFRYNSRGDSVAGALAWLLSAWGATLQITFIALLPLRNLMQGSLVNSFLGHGLLVSLLAIRLTSPLMLLPFGIFAIGMTLYAALRFGGNPYEARDFKDVLAIDLPPIFSELFAAIRVPVWLVVVILGFLVHFVQLLIQSFLEFGDKWAGRLLLVCAALVLPVTSLLLGHASFFGAMNRVYLYLSGDVAGFWSSIGLLLTVHFLCLGGLFLYVVAVAPVGLEVVPIPARVAPVFAGEYFRREGFLAAQATGKAFALYGLVFFAVPLASLLPGGLGLGMFSIAYMALITTAAVAYASRDYLAEKWELYRASYRSKPPKGFSE